MSDNVFRTGRGPWGHDADLIVRDYLERLRRRLAGLPHADQEDFLREIRSHIHEAFLHDADGGHDADGTEVARILRVLARLGEPSQVLAHRAGPSLIRGGLARALPFYVGAGVLLIFAGLPLGLAGTILLVSLALALIIAVLVYYATAVALATVGGLGVVVTLLKFVAPGFVVELGANWGLSLPHLDNLTGRLILSFLLLGVGGVLLWLGNHLMRGLRLLVDAAVRRIQEYRDRRRAHAWALIG